MDQKQNLTLILEYGNDWYSNTLWSIHLKPQLPSLQPHHEHQLPPTQSNHLVSPQNSSPVSAPPSPQRKYDKHCPPIFSQAASPSFKTEISSLFSVPPSLSSTIISKPGMAQALAGKLLINTYFSITVEQLQTELFAK
ncbi:hypothetical protein BTUL_0013g00800 [Botrytis tulipae]|uniref:Uncharacterized protein n=1 Tax=Botrytis tulipae TaxID=87230 RepID=A0A4Z1F2U6_9HELO|nr:hypothetical protein BTUL_0013g00800 [Botrytis tulipae]